ncbi:MAG: hypothetical protein PUC65_16550 [Clostridiales bacterium]|nr:hypothetical protein [Clostridiales bacterium]
MVQCRSCGKTIGEEYIYCTYCGKDTPKMEMIKKTECSKEDNVVHYPGFTNRISSDFNQHYLLLLLTSILTLIFLLCPMFQITKTEVNQSPSTKYYSAIRVVSCLKENYELNGMKGNLPEEMRNGGGLLIILNVPSVVLVAFFILQLLLHKDLSETYKLGMIALNLACVFILVSLVLYTFLPMTIYGDQRFMEGIETASTRLSTAFYFEAVIVLFSRFCCLHRCSERISQWKYLTR